MTPDTAKVIYYQWFYFSYYIRNHHHLDHHGNHHNYIQIKCKNFLATLLRLASDQPESVARNVRGLIQGLIDGRVEPELFTTKLQKELNSSPQPCLAPFLKKSLPYLQQSLAMRELTIEGVNPPNASQVY